MYILNLGARNGSGGQHRAPTTLQPGKRQGTHFTGGCVSFGMVWMELKNLASTGVRIPDRTAGSELMYRLRYAGHHNNIFTVVQFSVPFGLESLLLDPLLIVCNVSNHEMVCKSLSSENILHIQTVSEKEE